MNFISLEEITKYAPDIAGFLSNPVGSGVSLISKFLFGKDIPNISEIKNKLYSSSEEELVNLNNKFKLEVAKLKFEEAKLAAEDVKHARIVFSGQKYINWILLSIVLLIVVYKLFIGVVPVYMSLEERNLMTLRVIQRDLNIILYGILTYFLGTPLVTSLQNNLKK